MIFFTKLKFYPIFCECINNRLEILAATYCTSKQNLFQLLTNMKKYNPKPKAELRHIKYKQKYSGNLPVPAHAYLQVLGNGGRGSSPSVMLVTSSERYLFNCGESTQRFCSEHRMKLSRLENIFFTYKDWNNIGGVIGLSITAQDIGVPKLIIHSPPGVGSFFKAARIFTMINDIAKEQHNYWDPPFSDNAMTVEYVPIFGPELTKSSENNFQVIEDENVIKTESDNNSSDEEELSSDSTSDDERDTKRPHLDENATKDVALAFICKLHPKLGQLNFEKCLKLGVKLGPLLGKLKNGEDVILEDGTIVKSSDVVSLPESPIAFIVVECPTEDFLDSLLSQQSFTPYQISGETESTLEVIVHFTPEKVLQCERYQEWMNRFNPNISHLVVNDHNSGPCTRTNYRLQTKLNLINPHVFPLLSDQINQPSSNFKEIGHLKGIVRGDAFLKYYFREKLGYIREECIELDNNSVIDEVLQIPEVPEKLKILKSQLSSLNSLYKDKQYPEIVFLGTGSSHPSKERNVSSILLHISDGGCLLLDCGEGTFTQLIRFYGEENIDQILRKIYCIFISHAHCDHHLGLFSILKERRIAFLKAGLEVLPLTVFASPFMKGWLKTFKKYNCEDSKQVRLYLNSSFVSQDTERTKLLYDETYTRLNLKEFFTVRVKHCKNAFGAAITHKSGWKIVYSGDTMPCQSLVTAGKNCDVLIHEATLEDDLIHDAEKKAHSTTSQAIDMGLQMNAKFIILTHFSQRYAKIPIFNEQYSDRVAFAFDNMRVRPSDFKALPLFTPMLKIIFKEDYERIQCVSQKKVSQFKLEQKDIDEAAKVTEKQLNV